MKYCQGSCLRCEQNFSFSLTSKEVLPSCWGRGRVPHPFSLILKETDVHMYHSVYRFTRQVKKQPSKSWNTCYLNAAMATWHYHRWFTYLKKDTAKRWHYECSDMHKWKKYPHHKILIRWTDIWNGWKPRSLWPSVQLLKSKQKPCRITHD